MERLEKCQKISSFLKRYFPEMPQLNTMDFFDWKVYKSPAGEGDIALEIVDGQAVSSAVCTLVPIISHGEELTAVAIEDAYTHSDFRRKGLFTKLAKECIKNATGKGAVLCFGTDPNKMSRPVLERRLKLKSCNKAAICDCYKEIDIQLLHLKFYAKLKNRTISKMLSFMYWQYLKIKTLKSFAKGTSVIWHEINRFPEKLDGKWGKKRDDYTFFTKRDSDYLNWRFCESPNVYRVFIGEKYDETVCYFVIKTIDRIDHKVGYLCDYICMNDDQNVYFSLLAKAEEVLKLEGASIIELYCAQSSPYMNATVGSGYRKVDDVVVMVSPDTAMGKKVLGSDLKWHFTMSDGDGV
jgi:GNAT superfamily N-acetyltransferase